VYALGSVVAMAGMRVIGVGGILLGVLLVSGCEGDSDDDPGGGAGGAGSAGVAGSQQSAGTGARAAAGDAGRGGSGAGARGGSSGASPTSGGSGAVAGSSAGGSDQGGGSGDAGASDSAGAAGDAAAGSGGGGASSGGAGGGGAGGAGGEPLDNWLAIWGGTNADYARGIAISSNGVLIAAGVFGSASIDLDPTAGVDLHAHLRPVTTGMVSNQDAYVVWLNPDGTYRRGCTLAGNPGSFGSMTLAAGADDSAILAGAFNGTIDFDPGPGEQLVTSQRTGATFVLSLTSSCELAWGYPLYDAILSDYLIAARNRPLAADAAGNVYLIGTFTEFDFDLGPGMAVRTAMPAGGADGFLLKLDPDAGFSWVQTLPVVGASTVAVSPDGDTVVVGGAFGGTVDLDPTEVEELHTAVGTSDGYALAFNADGEFLWNYSHNGQMLSRFSVDTVAIGADGSAVLAAPHNFYLEHRGADGNPLWTWELAYGIRSAQVGLDGRLALLGRLSQGGQPNPADPMNPTPPSHGREFVSVFESNGTFVSSLAFGGQSGDTKGDQVIVHAGYAYVTGTISENPVSNYSDLPQGDTYVSLRPNGTDDAFLFRFKLP
jgi:hypothetical protein